jgi:peptidyl-prolyl cis-trans isomerase A (cyclophilin A)
MRVTFDRMRIARSLTAVVVLTAIATMAAAEPASELGAADAGKLVAFFEKLVAVMVANKADCPKMAAAMDKLTTENAAMLRAVMKQMAAGRGLPKDAEAKLTTLTAKDPEAFSKCAGNKAVALALKRVENPDLPPGPSAEVLAELKPPLAKDLEAYTKGIAGKGDLIATITTPAGTVKCQLFADKAPMTVANFVGLATGKKTWLDPKTSKLQKSKPFYDGTIFHRVIPDFMIQGGDPTGTGMGGPGYEFADEVTPNDKMAPGTLAMANAGPATNGSQFFITDGAPSHLNGKHTIFGACKPLDVVSKIARVKRSVDDKPEVAQTMKVTISRGKP